VTDSFQNAFERFLDRAPGPVFPRARQLYLRKYCLEGGEPEGFRTFLLQEEIEEAVGGALRIRAVSFAIVHWLSPQADAQRCLAYLERRWQLRPVDLTLQEGLWFRDGGAWARFTAPAVYERSAPTALLSPSGHPAAPGADPGPSS
jgi:hypothetical protein